MEVGGDDGGVVPGHIVPSNVVSEDENYVRPLPLPSNQLRETAESEAETLHRSKTRLFPPGK